MGTEDAPPLTVAEQVLADLAPELAKAVHAFLCGASPGTLPYEVDVMRASSKLRVLHDSLVTAATRRQAAWRVAVLGAAVRLQAVILYETINRHYVHAH